MTQTTLRAPSLLRTAWTWTKAYFSALDARDSFVLALVGWGLPSPQFRGGSGARGRDYELDRSELRFPGGTFQGGISHTMSGRADSLGVFWITKSLGLSKFEKCYCFPPPLWGCHVNAAIVAPRNQAGEKCLYNWTCSKHIRPLWILSHFFLWCLLIIANIYLRLTMWEEGTVLSTSHAWTHLMPTHPTLWGGG